MPTLLQSRHIVGLDAFRLKVTAAVCMTLDHIGAFGGAIPAIAACEDLLRTIGRIAAPLFLFVLVQSVRHTKSKPKFVARLYLAGMSVGLFDAAVNFFLGDTLGYHTPGNIFPTFFYTALYIVLLERLFDACRRRGVRDAALCAGILALSLAPSVFFDAIYGTVPTGSTLAARSLLQELRAGVLPSFYDVNYGIGLILLGVAMYFAKTPRRQCGVFAAFCLLCMAGALAAGRYEAVAGFSFFRFVHVFFDLFQCRMVLALPLMLLYNGRRGRPCKWFFYWYYPLHRQALIAAFALLAR